MKIGPSGITPRERAFVSTSAINNGEYREWAYDWFDFPFPYNGTALSAAIVGACAVNAGGASSDSSASGSGQNAATQVNTDGASGGGVLEIPPWCRRGSNPGL